MSLNNRLDRLEAALQPAPSLPTFSAWRRDSDDLVNVVTGERVPADVWVEEYGEPFTLTITSAWEGHDGAA